SVEAWFRPTSVDAKPRHLFIKDKPTSPREEYGLFFNDTSSGGTNGGLTFERIVAGVSVSATVESAAVQLGAWHHVVATYDGSTMRLYLDGEQRASAPSAASLGTKALPFRIGAKSAMDESGSLLGSMDEVAVYDRALAADRIKAHFNAR
ncbi:MAG: Autotransporter adhesin, partial [Labilithrix sp.]|nr:Autotransporter adhesin [Labilithrix sp.]